MVRRDFRTIRSEVEDMVLQTVDSTLGHNFIALVSRPLAPHGSGSHLQIYHMLTNILPFSPHSEYWWMKLGRPFASMLDTSNYALQTQCRFLCFFYHSIIRLMPPQDSPRSGSVMTIDGSPVELSWVLPQTCDSPGLGSAPHSVRQRRQVRFAIEPMHPVSGKLLKGSAVLDYLTSPDGGNLGMVTTADDCMAWRKKTESFLFPGTEDNSEIPDGSRFFVGTYTSRFISSDAVTNVS
ncbi:hypothetical protein EST38_g1481 [Candolleomyces aberdarensis]|uniref:Uncharacterized protein n=1 Tax=Candolleomyces aberdarensis TaxID=2316362 RepID=A0A4Q2DVB8_9AGAR|nr:hypothetical protein EST38_g1481 [Candolleomyces aberdarensis]